MAGLSLGFFGWGGPKKFLPPPFMGERDFGRGGGVKILENFCRFWPILTPKCVKNAIFECFEAKNV